ncbi:MAG: hypothetical protein VX265_09710 [Myxococcota bacterium]|nr:hypothetical protein [Myxococcota bacterium]
MRLLAAALLVIPMLASCGDKAVDDDDDDADSVADSGGAAQRPGETLECDTLELDIVGPAAPAVGDRWTLWLRCDGATLAGTMVLRFDPADIAEVDSNNALFRAAGDALMRFQVGSRRVEQEITVAP